MRVAVESVMVNAEVIRQDMLEAVSDAIRAAGPAIVHVLLYAPVEEQEQIMAETIGAIAADVISEYGEALEDNSVKTVETLAAAVAG